jgi:hypothetical protein
MAIDRRIQMRALVRPLATVAFDVGRPGFAHRTTVLALRHRTAFLVDVLEWAICMLAVADTMPADAGLASVLLAFDQHDDGIAERKTKSCNLW